jgi:hypothetical protein
MFQVPEEPCPTGTYNELTTQESLDACLSCPAGFLCTDEGTSNFTKYPCPPGGFCLEKSDGIISCPAGTYRTETRGRTLADCHECPGGFHCGNHTVEPAVCGPGSLCEPGSTTPQQCPAGSYCPGATFVLIPCPAGFYCPQNSSVPIRCDMGTFCPANSFDPTPCPLGMYGLLDDNATRYVRAKRALNSAAEAGYRGGGRSGQARGLAGTLSPAGEAPPQPPLLGWLRLGTLN